MEELQQEGAKSQQEKAHELDNALGQAVGAKVSEIACFEVG